MANKKTFRRKTYKRRKTSRRKNRKVKVRVFNGGEFNPSEMCSYKIFNIFRIDFNTQFCDNSTLVLNNKHLEDALGHQIGENWRSDEVTRMKEGKISTIKVNISDSTVYVYGQNITNDMSVFDGYDAIEINTDTVQLKNYDNFINNLKIE
jgi:hypothetical protein